MGAAFNDEVHFVDRLHCTARDPHSLHSHLEQTFPYLEQTLIPYSLVYKIIKFSSFFHLATGQFILLSSWIYGFECSARTREVTGPRRIRFKIGLQKACLYFINTCYVWSMQCWTNSKFYTNPQVRFMFLCTIEAREMLCSNESEAKRNMLTVNLEREAVDSVIGHTN